MSTLTPASSLGQGGLAPNAAPADRLVPEMLASVPGASSACVEAVLKTDFAVTTCVPACTVRAASGAPSRAMRSSLSAAAPGVQRKAAWPLASVEIACGSAVPPAEGAAVRRAPG